MNQNEQVNFGPHSKINENFNFRFHRNFDVTAIQEKMNSWNDEWSLDKSRQEMYPSHKETNTYFLMEHSNNWQYGDDYVPEYKCEDEEMWKLVQPIIAEFEKFIPGKVGKAVFIKLPAGKDVGGHRDFGDYLDVVRRFHIPIFTNPNVEFTVRDETLNMKVGETWEINNNRLHAVKNAGDTDRVHMLFDIMPNWAIKAAGTVDKSKRAPQENQMDENHI
jgi:hypothetical protein